MYRDSRYPAKPINKPNNISVLTPTRSRVDGLKRLFDNFQQTVADKNLFDVWLYVDDDDQATQTYIATNTWAQYDFKIHWHIAPRTKSMGEMFNQLWQINTTHPGIYFPCGDDVIINTMHWDIIVRDSFTAYHDGIMLGFPPEQAAAAYQVTYPIPSAQWLNALGYFITNRFHYWFDDMWLDDIAQMTGRKVLIPVYINNPDGKGKTPRMRNLPFWTSYYCATLEERYAEASRLFDIIFAGDENGRISADIHAKKTAAIHLHKNRLIAMDEIRAMEDESRCDESELSAQQLLRYLHAEHSAIHDLLQKLEKAESQGDSIAVIELIDFLNTSSYRIPDISFIKASHQYALGFTRDAVKTLTSELLLFTEDQKSARLLQHITSEPDKSVQPTCNNKSLEMPSWLELEDTSFLLFPEEIDQDLFYTIQRILYDDHSITTILDIGAGTGNGSTRALVEATTARDDVRIFCIEPDPLNCVKLRERYNDKIAVYEGISTAYDDYISDIELMRYYQFIESIYNFYPYSFIENIYHKELAFIRDMAVKQDLIKSIKDNNFIDVFDLVILDGSLFTGKADLAAVYGARYIILNYAWSTKNHYNIDQLLTDPQYKVATGNLKSRCGYLIFEKIPAYR